MDGLRAVNVYAIETEEGLTLVDGGWAIEASRKQLDESLAVDRPHGRRHHPLPGHARAPRPLHAGGDGPPRVRVRTSASASASGQRWTSYEAGTPTPTRPSPQIRAQPAPTGSRAAGRRRSSGHVPDPSMWELPRHLARRRPAAQRRQPHARRGRDPRPHPGALRLRRPRRRAAVRRRPRAADHHPVDRVRAGVRRRSRSATSSPRSPRSARCPTCGCCPPTGRSPPSTHARVDELVAHHDERLALCLASVAAGRGHGVRGRGRPALDPARAAPRRARRLQRRARLDGDDGAPRAAGRARARSRAPTTVASTCTRRPRLPRPDRAIWPKTRTRRAGPSTLIWLVPSLG